MIQARVSSKVACESFGPNVSDCCQKAQIPYTVISRSLLFHFTWYLFLTSAIRPVAWASGACSVLGMQLLSDVVRLHQSDPSCRFKASGSCAPSYVAYRAFSVVFFTLTAMALDLHVSRLLVTHIPSEQALLATD